MPEAVLLAEKTDERPFADEPRMLAAVKLFELGSLSSGRAAELAGMTRVEFILSLGRHRLYPAGRGVERTRTRWPGKIVTRSASRQSRCEGRGVTAGHRMVYLAAGQFMRRDDQSAAEQ